MQQQTIQTTPAPNPLPTAWARAVANSITAEFRRHDPPNKNYGWEKANELRAHHVTGSPPGHTIKTTATIPRSALLSTTEVINSMVYLRGTIAPDDYPGLDLPPMAWLITQLQAAGALAERQDLQKPLNDLMRKNRWGLPYQAMRNRHGNPTLRPSQHNTTEERQAITLVAAAAQIVVIDELDYADLMLEDFDGLLTLRLLEESAA